MSFGYKTQWLAVRGRTLAEVARSLRLTDIEPMSWEDGNARAYREGIFVAGPVDGWVLAHSARGWDSPEAPGFIEYVVALSRDLGEVQFFGSHRGSDYYAWVLAVDGVLRRAYMFADYEVSVFSGEVTEAEQRLGIGTLEALVEDDHDGFFATVPHEKDLMAIAAAWSVDPSEIVSHPEPGLFGRRQAPSRGEQAPA